MELSLVQLRIIKSWVITNKQRAFDAKAAVALNALVVDPAPFYVWRTSVEVSEFAAALEWSVVEALPDGRARVWEWLTRSGALNPADPNVREAITLVWSSADVTYQAILALCRRPARLAEALLANGEGTEKAPATLALGAEGLITVSDIGASDKT